MAIVTSGLLAGAAITGGAYLVDRLALATIRPQQKSAYDTSPSDLPFVSRRIEFDSAGSVLRGWLLETEGSADRALALLVHGWSANAGTVLRLARPLLEAGFPVMAFDVRGHGASDPAPFVTIRHYRDDVHAALRFAGSELPFPRRVAIGHSMGGAAVVLAAARGAPVDGVGIVHGAEDRRVNPEHGRRLARAAGVPVVEVVGRGHTDVLDSPEAHEAIRDLMESA